MSDEAINKWESNGLSANKFSNLSRIAMTLLVLHIYLRENSKLSKVGFLTWRSYFNFCLVLLQIINGSQWGHLSIKSQICWAYQKQGSACSLSTTISITPRDGRLFPPKQFCLSASNIFLWLSCHHCVPNIAQPRDICSTFPPFCHHRWLCQMPIT